MKDRPVILVVALLLSTLGTLSSCALVDRIINGKPEEITGSDPFEPNDLRDDAAPLPPGTTATGFISPGDLDWFLVETAHEGYWDWIDLAVTGVDPTLEVSLRVENQSGVEIASADASEAGQEVPLRFATVGGTYYVEVGSRVGPTGYGYFTLGVTAPGANDEFEPNDTRTEAHDFELLPIESVTGFLVNSADADWFRFDTGTVGVYHWLDIDLTNVEATVTPQITVYDSGGAELISTSAHAAGEDARVRFPSKGGTHYLLVNSYFQGDDHGSYQLRADYTLVNDSHEPNDTASTALAVGETPIVDLSGYLVGTQDQDWFVCSTENDGYWDRIELSLSQIDETVAPSISVYDVEGDELCTSQPGEAGADTSCTVVTNGGLLVFSVSAEIGGIDYGAYTVSIDELAENDAFEPNEGVADAAVFSTSSVPFAFEAALVSAADVDWYALSAPGDETYRFSLVNDALDEELHLEFFRPNAQSALERMTVQPGEEGCIDYARPDTATGEEGIYFRVVRENGYAQGAGSVTTERYEISVTGELEEDDTPKPAVRMIDHGHGS